MNVLLNMWDGLNHSPFDKTIVEVGLNYMFWTQFVIDDPIKICALWQRPRANKSSTILANYLRWSVEFVFMLEVDSRFTVNGGGLPNLP